MVFIYYNKDRSFILTGMRFEVSDYELIVNYYEWASNAKPLRLYKPERKEK